MSGTPTNVRAIETGAELRYRGLPSSDALLFVGGGTGRVVPGTWCATNELLADALAARHPALLVAELRYRVKSWRELPSCVADARAAIDRLQRDGVDRVLLAGFSMGGGVAVAVADASPVVALLGLAPWLHPHFDLTSLVGKRLDIVHGAWDRALPGIPGVLPAISRAAFQRARALGVAGTYVTIPRGMHGAAVRRASGALLRLPGWRRWVEDADAAVARLLAGGAA